MLEHLPDFLRAVVSTTMNVFVMLSLLQPKYGKKATNLAMLGVMAADLGTATYCYLSGNLTMLAKIDIVLFAVLCFLIKPFFKDTLMQWMFSYITLQNTSYIIVILSFLIARYLPYPAYGNTIIRLILFSGAIFVLRLYVRPLYRQMVEHWSVYFYVALAVSVAFSYYVLTSEDIIITFTEQAIPLLLIITIAIASYVSIGLSLRFISREYAVKEENLKINSDKEFLELAANSMSEQLNLMETAEHQSRIVAHDHRHANIMILELLEQGKSDDAITFLQTQIQIFPQKIRNFCENTAVNATMIYYVKFAEEKGIKIEVNLDIPNKLVINSLELAMAVSNLFENAINGCEKLSKNTAHEGKKIITFTCHDVGRLALEIRNSCTEDTAFDENGYPVTLQKNHGSGTKSVIAFAKKYDAELIYQVENGYFKVWMLV